MPGAASFLRRVWLKFYYATIAFDGLGNLRTITNILDCAADGFCLESLCKVYDCFGVYCLDICIFAFKVLRIVGRLADCASDDDILLCGFALDIYNARVGIDIKFFDVKVKFHLTLRANIELQRTLTCEEAICLQDAPRFTMIWSRSLK